MFSLFNFFLSFFKNTLRRCEFHIGAARSQQRRVIFSVCFVRNRYLIHGFYEHTSFTLVIGANFLSKRFITVVRIALRDVEPRLNFDIFAGATLDGRTPIIAAILRFRNCLNSNKSSLADIPIFRRNRLRNVADTIHESFKTNFSRPLPFSFVLFWELGSNIYNAIEIARHIHILQYNFKYQFSLLANTGSFKTHVMIVT